MDKVVEMVPLWVRRNVNTIIAVVGILCMLAFLILAAQNWTLPITQMPWYFWPLLIGIGLTSFVPTSQTQVVFSGGAKSGAWLRVVIAGIVFMGTLFIAFYLSLTVGILFFLAMALDYGVRGAQILLRREDQDGRTAVR